jgi:hypothetical protein
MVDRPAFEDPVRLLERETRVAGQAAPDRVVAGKVVLAAPSVEAESPGAAVLARSQDDRAGVAKPDVAERLDDDFSERRKVTGYVRGVFVACNEPDLFALAAKDRPASTTGLRRASGPLGAWP